MPGVREVKSKVARKHVHVTYEPSKVLAERLKEMISDGVDSYVIGDRYIRGQTTHYTRVPKRDARAVRSDPQPWAPRRRRK